VSLVSFHKLSTKIFGVRVAIASEVCLLGCQHTLGLAGLLVVEPNHQSYFDHAIHESTSTIRWYEISTARLSAFIIIRYRPNSRINRLVLFQSPSILVSRGPTVYRQVTGSSVGPALERPAKIGPRPVRRRAAASLSTSPLPPRTFKCFSSS
jgi:hypothetical protein